MSKGYRSELPKEVLIYNIQYHILKKCSTAEECIEVVKTLLEHFEEKDDSKKANI